MDMKLELPKFEEVPMTAELQQLLMEARTNVVLGSSIYAYTMMRCEYIFTRDLPIPTAASCVHDDRNIVFIDPDFFTKILTNRAQRAFVLLHEIDHIFFMHQKHCIDLAYDHETYNRAADYYINLSLSGIYLENGVRKQNKKYRSYFEMPSCGLYDEMFIGWSPFGRCAVRYRVYSPFAFDCRDASKKFRDRVANGREHATPEQEHDEAAAACR